MKKNVCMSLWSVLILAGMAALSMPHRGWSEDLPVYVIPDDAHCVIQKQSRKTYCTDKQGVPITGELRRYRDNKLLRLYHLQEGYLNGKAVSYDAKERVKSEKNYMDGVLSGETKTYYPTGTVESEITYANGKKEGIAKFYDESGTLSVQAMYQNNRLNGKMQIYTPKKELLYNLKNENDRYISGVYYYFDGKGRELSADIPPVILEAVNRQCLALLTEKTTSACAAALHEKYQSCDAQWRNDKRPEVRRYFARCQKEKTNE